MILLRIALRNIVATKVRTLIIGLLTIFGTTLVVLGGSLLSTLEGTMAKSIIGSVAGHLQVFSADARDSLDLFSPPTGTPNLGVVTDYPRVKEVLEGLDEVKAVVPMGNDFATVFSGNILDIKLAQLRQAIADGDSEREDVLLKHIRRIVSLLGNHMDNLKSFVDMEAADLENEDSLANLARANRTEFWDGYREHRDERLEFLENKIAKLAMDEKMLFLRYIGTDTEAFARNFELFEMVKGEPIPKGQRGLLFSDFIYEMMVKHQVARRLDWLDEQVTHGRTIAEDRSLANRVAQNVRQYKDILFQMDGPSTRELVVQLQAFLGSNESDETQLLEAFLDMNDENFASRYAFFYEHIAPKIILYQVGIGDILTIRAFTRSGYSTSVNVKVYGTYRFRGLEKSALSGAYSLIDLMSFRDLYGFLSDAALAELEEIRKDSGIEAVARENADEMFFGGDDSLVEEVEEGGFDEFAGVDMKDGGRRFTDELMERVYTQEEIDGGITTNASIVLADGVPVPRGKQVVEEAIEKAGLNLQVIDWREASGLVGQFIGVVWIVLVVAILIIFLVALVIINNSMVMATLDRTREIGTMRAIGAQRGYVLRMFLLESSVLGLGFGLVGVALGSAIVLLLGKVGIPAVSDELYFLFAGPRLYPLLMKGHLVVAFLVVFLVSLASTIYPARLAAGVAPVKAMGKED